MLSGRTDYTNHNHLQLILWHFSELSVYINTNTIADTMNNTICIKMKHKTEYHEKQIFEQQGITANTKHPDQYVTPMSL
jgi:hypothetical protein